MPILGALAVIDRIEKVMKEGFADSIRTIESNLEVEGALTGLDPAIPIPTDLGYGRDEDGTDFGCGRSFQDGDRGRRTQPQVSTKSRKRTRRAWQV